MSFADYQQTTRVCYLDPPEWGLFKTFDGETGRWVFRWDRCQYALGRRVDLEVEHAPDCPHAARADAHRRMGCQCRLDARVTGFFWLVDPRDKEVESGEEVVRHGERPAAYGKGENGCT